MRIHICIFLFFAHTVIFAQNMLKNSSFENGASIEDDCVFSPMTSNTADEFDSKIDVWKQSRLKVPFPLCTFECMPTPDILQYSICPIDFPSPLESHRALRTVNSVDGTNKYYEGVRQTLNPYLISDKKYELRFISAFKENSHAELWTYFTKKDEEWWNSNDNEIVEIKLPFPLIESLEWEVNKWYGYKSIFQIPTEFTEINNVVLINGNFAPIIIDDVRLWEYCKDVLLLQNIKHYCWEPSYEAKIIVVGENIGDPDPIGPVIVRSTADIIYKAENQIVFEPGFSIETGAKFITKIAPCGRDCPYLPTVTAGANQSICGVYPLQIGAYIDPFGLTFQWSAEPANAIQYLDNPSISNPFFTPPANDCGNIKYTLIVLNECNESISDDIIISYNTTGVSNASLQLSNTNVTDQGVSFTANTTGCVNFVNVSIYSSESNYQNIIYSHSYFPEVDYPCCSFNWSTTGLHFSPCNDYLIKVRAYNPCNNTYDEEMIQWVIINKEPLVLSYTNAITAGGQNPCLVIDLVNADYWDVKIHHGFWGNVIYHQNGIVSSGQIQAWCPANNTQTEGWYLWTGEFSNACSAVTYGEGWVYLWNTSGNKVIDTTNTINNIKTDEQNNPAFNIYPNPTTNSFIIEYPIMEACKPKLIVTDIYNNILFTRDLEKSKEEVSLTSYSAGMYIVKIICDEQTYIRKVIKQ